MIAAIAGYGNLGRGAEAAIAAADDCELFGIFTRRTPDMLHSPYGTRILPLHEASRFRGEIDVMLICTGSAGDLPEMTPALAESFTCVDSFDTHGRLAEHFSAVERAARRGGNLAVIAAGWDPGLFSLARMYGEAVLPQGESYTFWGRGISQGHSEAVRRIAGVLDAREYTIPLPEALEAVRRGERPTLSPRQRHRRECFVVAEPSADTAAIERAIVTMPEYFADYDTSVHFISERELAQEHSDLPHGGSVIRQGCADGACNTLELSLALASNPAFTGSVLLAFARAAHRLSLRGESGCRTVLDIPPALLSPLSRLELLALL